ncbi:MAG TPA: hypothetical protein VEJ16_07300, partial [Alphaproteobacteria bacterium]|nr:hypothetical protein [Alphaproteobacteria bacterium]
MYDDDRDALAAEYVLGTLSAEEREQAEALLTLDSSFAEIVRIWEHRLGELNVMVEAVEPPPDLWEKIKTEIDSTRRSDETDFGSTEVIGESAPQSVPTPLADTAVDDTPEPDLDLVPDLLSDRPKDLDYSDRPKDLEGAQGTDLDETSLVNALASTLLPSTPPPKLPSTPPPNFDISTPEASALPMPETGSAGAGADIVALRRGVRRWRGLTMAMGAIAALLAVYVALARLAPGF